MSETVAQDPPINVDHGKISQAKDIRPSDLIAAAAAVEPPHVSTLMNESMTVSTTTTSTNTATVATDKAQSEDHDLPTGSHDASSSSATATGLTHHDDDDDDDDGDKEQQQQQQQQVMIQLPPSTTQAEEDARLSAQKDQQRKAEEEAHIQAEHELLRQQEEEISKQQAEEEARIQADHEPERLESEAVTRIMAEEQARIQAEHEPARWEAEAQARSQAEEEARLQAERDINDVLGGTVEEPTNNSSASLMDQLDTGVDHIHEPLAYPDVTDGSVNEENNAPFQSIPDDSKKSFVASVSDMVTEIIDFVVEPVAELTTGTVPPTDAAVDELVTETKYEPQESSHELEVSKVTVESAAETVPISPTDETGDVPESDMVVDRTVSEEAPDTADPISLPPTTVAIADETIQTETSGEKLEPAHEAQATNTDDTPETGITVMGPVEGSTESLNSTTIPEGTVEPGNDLSSITKNEEVEVNSAPTNRVSTLVSKYMDSVNRESLTGDSPKFESSAKSITFSPTPSPVTPRATIELKELPKIDDIRAKFEGSAKGSQPHVFEFGEAFRQKQRFSLLADREKKKEAQMKLHGYDELMLTKANGASGEVDSSSIEKTFSFQTSNEDVSLHDGTCKIDYKNETYKGMVFVVHRTRGMLVFNRVDLAGNESYNLSGTHIPGGPVSEEEFVAAAQQTGYSKMQLQLAAREGAARQLFETTGIDIRQKLDRLTPAVLQMNPPVDSKGTQYLKNEHENNLYYFLQISDDDFVSEETGDVPLTTPNGETNSPLKLRLSRGFADFTFIKDPLVAVQELKENGDPSVTAALSMVMNQSVGPNGEPAKATSYQGTSDVQTVLIPHDNDDTWNIGLTTVRGDVDSNKNADPPILRTDNEADLQPKASVDSEQAVVVDCCCGSFW